MPSQWEFRSGLAEGISMGASSGSPLLLVRVAEQWGAKVSFHPKPLQWATGMVLVATPLLTSRCREAWRHSGHNEAP